MTTITVNVIRKFSGNYTYTIDDTGRITYPEKPQEPEKFRRVSRAKTPAQTSPAPAAKITPARVQAPAAAAIPEPVQADPEPTPAADPVPAVQNFKPSETDGIPGARDKFHFITLEGPIYNGYRLPLPEPGAKVYPVYFVVNQTGALMQTFQNEPMAAENKMGWFYRSAGINGIETAQELIEGDIKRLRTWQRKHYAKASPETPEAINIPGSGTPEKFQAYAADLYRALKDYGKKVFIDLAGYFFPAHILAAACKLAGDEKAACKLEEQSMTVRIERHQDDRGYWIDAHDEIQKFTALTVRLGRAVYNFRAQTNLPDGARLVTCSI